jgi:hypothetical protein
MINLSDERIEKFDKTVEMGRESRIALLEYWKEYSIYTSFEYWMMVALLIFPLIVLYFKIDKKRLFFYGFYGFSFHVIFAYVDMSGKMLGLWNYPFPIYPLIPGLALDTSLVPVIFMLVYQYTFNHNKNYYVYTIIAAAIFSFILKPIIVEIGLFKMYRGTSYIHLFLSFFIPIIGAKLITNVFLWVDKKYNKERTYSI